MRNVIVIGEHNIKKIYQDAGTQVSAEIRHTGCQHEIELDDKEIQAVDETMETGIMTDPVEFRPPSAKLDFFVPKNTDTVAHKPIVLGMDLSAINPEPQRLAAPKKKRVYKAENTIDLAIFSGMSRHDSLVLQTNYRKDDGENESPKLDQTIMSESDDALEVSFSTYSFEHKSSKFRNSKLFRKLTDLEIKNLYIHNVFSSYPAERGKQYVSSKRMNKIALYTFRSILKGNDISDILTMVYEYFAEKTRRDTHAIAMLRAVYAYCQVRECGNRTKIDMLINFVPFKMVNLISTFKEIFRGLFYSLDE
jgi:hypothetical protein